MTSIPIVVLRPYQQRAVDATRSALRAGKRCVVVVAPTGAGKTVIAAHIMACGIARGSRVLFLAHRRELIKQTRNKLIDAGVPALSVGIIMAGFVPSPDAPIQVASVDSLRNRERPAANLVIVDECHRSLAKSYLDLIAHYRAQGATVLGLTATPYRADGGGLGDVYEHLEVVATPSKLIEGGFIVAPLIYAGQAPDLSGVHTRRGDYVESELAEATNQQGLVGNIVDAWRTRALGVRTVAFAVNVEHSQAIAAQFLEAGVPAEHLDGATPTKDRDAMLARLESGETLIVSNCGVLCEGWDQPAVKCAILARPTKSTGLYLQQAGRILRPYQGQRAVVLDHAGNVHAHGFPQDDRDLSLSPTHKSRGGAPTKTCPSCSAVLPLGCVACECGHEFEMSSAGPIWKQHIDGDLVLHTPELRDQMRRDWDVLCREWHKVCAARMERGYAPLKPGWVYSAFVARHNSKPPKDCKLPHELASPEAKSEAYRALIGLAQARGYKPGWAYHRFFSRFGHGPETGDRMRSA